MDIDAPEDRGAQRKQKCHVVAQVSGGELIGGSL